MNNVAEFKQLVSEQIKKFGEAEQSQIDAIANYEVSRIKEAASFFPFGDRVVARIAELISL